MRELIGLSPLARGTRLRGSDTRRKAPVYPRWRGEHHYHPHFGIKRCGLSPLARGTLQTTNRPGNSHRFIPAGAGNTRIALHYLSDNPVYPRWRGEHAVLLASAGGGDRFIPAGAGNTCSQNSILVLSSVYPRWRGEHSSISRNIALTCGLSPLARGTQIRRNTQ